MKTFSAKPSDVTRDWWVIDAEGMVLGRLAAIVATRLRGKHKAIYTPHIDCGDHVVVVNAAKVRLTGRKRTDKVYYKHTGFPGGTALEATAILATPTTAPQGFPIVVVRVARWPPPDRRPRRLPEHGGLRSRSTRLPKHRPRWLLNAVFGAGWRTVCGQIDAKVCAGHARRHGCGQQ